VSTFSSALARQGRRQRVAMHSCFMMNGLPVST
jgi:hypothetical protein